MCFCNIRSGNVEHVARGSDLVCDDGPKGLPLSSLSDELSLASITAAGLKHRSQVRSGCRSGQVRSIGRIFFWQGN